MIRFCGNRGLLKVQIALASASFLVSSLALPSLSQPQSASTSQAGWSAFAPEQGTLVDDTLLVMLAPHSDRQKVKSYLASESNVQTVKDMHIDSEDYSILHVKPLAGQREATIQRIGQMMPRHSEIMSISRNILCQRAAPAPAPPTPPNDPLYSTQWPLSVLNLPAAQALYTATPSIQKQPPRITVLASGTTPVSDNNELGAYITQYNALNPASIFAEPVQNGTDVEGDIDSSITGCLTNNGTLIAGLGSFGTSSPLKITMLRMTTTDSVSTANLLGALVWAANNQAARGGRGPVNVSYGSFPGTPLWGFTPIQSIARTLLNHGDILVMSAGDSSTTYTKNPPGAVVVVQASDNNNNLFTKLSTVQNDSVAAPGSPQPAVVNGSYTTSYYGTSFSAPLWSASIALLLSVNTKLTCSQANTMLLQTGTALKGVVRGKVVIPSLGSALKMAAGKK